jgi:hypothetical protein
MPPIMLPAWRITQGEEARYQFQFSDAVGPVDFTETVDGAGWAAAVTLAARIGAEAFYTGSAALSADGWCEAVIPAATTAGLAAHPALGGGVTGAFQIVLTAPVREDDRTLQGQLIVAGRLA